MTATTMSMSDNIEISKERGSPLADVWGPDFSPACHEQLFTCECVDVDFHERSARKRQGTGRKDDATAGGQDDDTGDRSTDAGRR